MKQHDEEHRQRLRYVIACNPMFDRHITINPSVVRAAMLGIRIGCSRVHGVGVVNVPDVSRPFARHSRISNSYTVQVRGKRKN
jgi:hypothetical protein